MNAAKQAAGYKAIDNHLLPSFKYVGIGSGSTVVYCVERIAQLREKVPEINSMYFVPTGYQSRQLIVDAGLPLMEIDQFSAGELDIVFDGADEVDSQLNCIKGGGGCQFQEKLVGKCSKKFIAVVDDSKISQRLGEHWLQGIPIEVVPSAHKKVAVDLKRLGASKVTLRSGGKSKAGPMVTDNANFVLDAYFGEIAPERVAELDRSIKLLVGVVETGLFDYADEVYIGRTSGPTEILTRK